MTKFKFDLIFFKRLDSNIDSKSSKLFVYKAGAFTYQYYNTDPKEGL